VQRSVHVAHAYPATAEHLPEWRMLPGRHGVRARHVAAAAQQHCRVTRNDRDSGGVASVSLLDANERQEGIARMLSGAAVTAEARAAATALMATGS